MTDASLKELSRAAAIGSVEDQAAYLRARVRAGDLSAEMLDLAAYCGDPGSRAQDPTLTTGSYYKVFCPEFSLWLWRLLDHGPGIVVRATVAGGKFCRAQMEACDTCVAAFTPYRELCPNLNCVARRQIRAAEAWLECPCLKHREACEKALPDYPGDRHVPASAACLLIDAGANNPVQISWTIDLLVQVATPGLRTYIQNDLIKWALA